jgi:phosphoglycolate phosphatase-like HAD superfamily hydrolase
MKRKIVIYDVDNVLFFTRKAVFARYNDISITLGLGPLPEGAMDELFGTTGDYILEKLFPGKFEEAKKLNKNGNVHFELMVPETGAKEAIEKLINQGIKVAIATNRREYTLKTLLQTYGFLKYFDPDLVVCQQGDEFLKGERFFKNIFKNRKPDPECINIVLSLAGIKPEEAIYIGDEEEDRGATEKAGAFFVGFKTKFSCPARIEDHRRIFDYLNN